MSKIRLALILALFAMLGVLYVAHAAATWVSEPVWNNALVQYEAIIEVSGSAENTPACWSVSPSDDSSAVTTTRCACTAGACLTSTPPDTGDGTYNCIMPGAGIVNSPNQPLQFIGLIVPGEEAKCPGTDSSISYIGDHVVGGTILLLDAAPNGTGPNAVTLARLDASSSTPRYVLPLGIVGMLLIAGSAGFAILVRRQ